MFRVSRWLILPALLCAAPSYSQQVEPGKRTEGPVEAEVRLMDNSNVRMLILEEKLEVCTRFGKLTVPMREVLKIDFGVHISPATEKKVVQAIEALGHDNYKTREVALKDLVDMGPQAYPQVYQAAKSDQPEVAKRASMALDKMRTRHTDEKLRLREDDIITTTSFPIIGRITTNSLKAKNETFGEVELKLGQVRAIHCTHAPHETSIEVDASRYGSATNQWLDTAFEVRSGMRLIIATSGQINLWPPGGGYLCSARGFNTNGPSPPGTQFTAGALLGRIGETGPVFLVGESHDSVPNRDGKLYLHIVPSPWGNASTGVYQVKITPRGEFGE